MEIAKPGTLKGNAQIDVAEIHGEFVGELTARTRLVPVSFEGFAPEAGTPVSAGAKSIGTLGSSAQGRGLAMLRLDRAADALTAGEPLTAGGVEMRLVKPDWAQFAWPGEAKAAE